jgi:hypothetical protein
LEQFEELVWNLSNDINVDECQLKIEKFRNENAELIERNRKRLTSDDIWMKQNLEDEKRMKSRINAIEMNVDNSVCLVFLKKIGYWIYPESILSFNFI